jgi:hypothetical protein
MVEALVVPEVLKVEIPLELVLMRAELTTMLDLFVLMPKELVLMRAE